MAGKGRDGGMRMRCREVLALYAGLAALLLVSAFTLGALTTTLQPVEAAAAAHSHAVSVLHDSIPDTPDEDGDQDVALQQRKGDAEDLSTAQPPPAAVVTVTVLPRVSGALGNGLLWAEGIAPGNPHRSPVLRC